MFVKKLIFRELPGMPVRGEDIVAFKVKDNIIEALCIGEAKTVASFRPGVVKKAYDKLEETYRIKPLTLTLISRIFWYDNKDELASQIDDILALLGS